MNPNFLLLPEALQLNKTAVDRMAAADFKVALKVLIKSLGKINEFLLARENEPTDPPSASADASFECDIGCVQVPGFLGDNDTFYVYNHAFVLPPALRYDWALSLPTAVLVLFNVALGFHQQGKVLNCRQRTQKALFLYDQCVAILELPEALADGRMLPIVSFLRLAIANNQAAILYEAGDFAASTVFLTLVEDAYAHLWTHLSEVPVSSTIISFVTSQEPYLNEILLNVTCLSTIPTAAPLA